MSSIDKHREVYLDYAAATPVDPRVFAAMEPYFSVDFYNPSAPYSRAREIRAAIERAREVCAHGIGARAAQVIFTAGATEANNLALDAAPAASRILCDAAEHESILAPARACGAQVVGVSGEGLVNTGEFARSISPDTGLVSVELVSGETGALQPLREISRIVQTERRRRLDAGETRPLYLHTDASQAGPLCALNVASLGVDMLTLSASKMYGPKQVGLLWASDEVRLRPLVRGGGQERGLRSGTENVAGIIGFAKALELATDMRKDEVRRLGELRDRLLRALRAEFSWMRVNGPKKAKMRLSNFLHVSFPGLEARRLVILLEARGVYVGTGSACAASKMEISPTLLAMGLTEALAKGSLRISLGRPTTKEDIDYAAAAIIEAVHLETDRLSMSRERS